ncbi:hypothetical protein C2E23DRAFT_933792 [Lenzites betulinus]|nr:hypothetical protein C2E23DRAFT_933792 [Lenzites betulinus]
MPRADRLARLRAFPRAPAPNDDSATVKSNLSDEDVQLLQNILAHHVAHRPDSTVFGHAHARNLKLTEAFVRIRRAAEKAQPSPDDLEAVTVCEIPMLNVHGTLSGACAMHIIDIGTFSALFALGAVVGIDPSGFSTSINMIWHAPAVQGTMLRLVNTSLTLKPRMAAAHCEMYDGTGRLLVSATQIVAPIKGSPGRAPVAVRGGAGDAKL